MNIVKKFLKFFIFFILIIFITSFTAYSVLILKPEKIISISNNLNLFEFKVEFNSVKSNKNYLKPEYEFKDFIIQDINSNSLISIADFEIGLNIFQTIRNDFFSISTLKVNNIILGKYKDSNNLNSKPIKIEINNFETKNNDFELISSKIYIYLSEGNASIKFGSGKLNGNFFKKLSLLMKPSSENVLFDGLFYLSEKEIIEKDLINLSNFSDVKINLTVMSKGSYDLSSGKINSLNKYIFNNSRLTTDTDFSINSIDMQLFQDFSSELHGIFKSSIPQQRIEGSINIKDAITLRTNLNINLDNIIEENRYFSIEGEEVFQALLKIKNDKSSLVLKSELNDTKFSSEIAEISKDFQEPLITTVEIDNLSYPTYLIKNKAFEIFVDSESNGYFNYGNGFKKEDIVQRDKLDGFFIYLNLENIDIENLIVDFSENSTSKLRSIFIKVKKLNLFNNIYFNQKLNVELLIDETKASFEGVNLNGKIRTDKTGFTKIEVFDSKFEFDGVGLADSNTAFEDRNINIRFIGKNIQTYDDIFQDVDFYLLRNKNITTIDNIKIKSKNFNIGPFNDEKKAYISFDKNKDLYKVRGSYEIEAKRFPFKNSFNYNFDYLSTDLNIQWNSLSELKNLEGEVNFLIKGLESKTSLPDSTLLRALKVLNLNAIIENINNDTSLGSSNLTVNRAEGDFYVSQNRAFINKPIKLETSEAKMEWLGEILKGNDGVLNELNLDLKMRLKVSENIPWYAAIFGGFPALAGGLIFENIIDDSLDNVSTFKFKVSGNIQNPEIKRLN